jgi:hypothetical protein
MLLENHSLLAISPIEAQNWGVNNLQGSPEFSALSEQEQDRYRKVALSVVGLAQRYAIPVALAPPPSIGGKVNTATGCILQLGSRWFAITADHVLSEYEERKQLESLNWQFGHLPPMNPLERIVWRDAKRDVVFLEMSQQEVAAACDTTSLVFSASAGWPPLTPVVGQVVLVAGFPRLLREVGSSNIESGPYSAMFRVATVGEGHFCCQIEQNDLISFDGGSLPPPGADVGGLSGGPVALMADLAYPLVGIVTEHSQEYDILRIATFDGIFEQDFRSAPAINVTSCPVP